MTMFKLYKLLTEEEIDRSLPVRAKALSSIRVKLPAIMYHVTEYSNKDNIEINGLVVNTNRKSKTGAQLGVYLTNDPDDILEHQLDIELEDPAIVSVRSKGLDLVLDPEYYDCVTEQELADLKKELDEGDVAVYVYSENSIPASNIVSIERVDSV